MLFFKKYSNTILMNSRNVVNIIKYINVNTKTSFIYVTLQNYPQICNALISAPLCSILMLHIRLLYANKNFLVTYLITQIITFQTRQQLLMLPAFSQELF